MSDIAIQVVGLGKRYPLRGRKAPYNTLRGAMSDKFSRGAAKNGQTTPFGLRRQARERFWALKDVSFDINNGEVLGVIGNNGAGKSTLLKILSRITEPTVGYADVHGRIGCLLEVGTGFHPELTGRENIFLSGAVLGMKRADIARRFDEIVSFSEIEKFIETPVKWYSSGMYLRLAFSVAAHLEPDILIVDEVLAVGDASFQKKCMGTMDRVGDEGRTVLLVSHNLSAITQLCHRCIWLEGGTVAMDGPAADVVHAYSQEHSQAAEGEFPASSLSGDGHVELIGFRVANQKGEPLPLPVTNEDVLLSVRYRAVERIEHPAWGLSVWNHSGVLMTSISTVEQGVTPEPLEAGEGELQIRLSRVAYLPGMYKASVWLANAQGHIYAKADQAINFEIGRTDLYGITQVDNRHGAVYTHIDFAVSPPT